MPLDSSPTREIVSMVTEREKAQEEGEKKAQKANEMRYLWNKQNMGKCGMSYTFIVSRATYF